MSQIIPCQSCGQKNRLPVVLPAGKVARCGRCHSGLVEAAADEPFADDECQKCGADDEDLEDCEHCGEAFCRRHVRPKKHACPDYDEEED